jgi:SNF family Na+-dependent transporter
VNVFELEIKLAKELISFHQKEIKLNKICYWIGFILIIITCLTAYYNNAISWSLGFSLGVNMMIIMMNFAEEVRNKNEIQFYNNKIKVYLPLYDQYKEYMNELHNRDTQTQD